MTPLLLFSVVMVVTPFYYCYIAIGLNPSRKYIIFLEIKRKMKKG